MHIDNIITELNKDWFDRFTFSSVSTSINGLEFTQNYYVNYEKRPDPESKFIVHGTDTYMLAINHLCAFFIHLIRINHADIFTPIQNRPFYELSKRILIAKSELEFLKPVFTQDIEVKSKIESFKDRYEKHKMVFLDASVDINQGLHKFNMNGVINMRDELF
ncbi:hypothetical protein A6J71_10355 [Enterobacter cancerogenus]|uniref:hypothetical protein n=1 Tax=Enterobacter cancerogenus TaxID=69218 RepID=UPI000C9CA6EE|nr:hypothetical protein [Enterobacter cancerogenus]PNF10529.1 hypothetical protein A6J71_10355 [Enterobacter cancerogenus]